MSQIFISYSRRDHEIAEFIVTALAKFKFTPWIDWRNIPKGENFGREIQHGITRSDAMLFLISPNSVNSGWCKKEIEFAVKNGKRILPIIVNDTDLNSIPVEIANRNWIFCRVGRDEINRSIDQIRIALQTDYKWVKYHTDLQIKALNWEQKGDTSWLLNGKALKEAEQTLAYIVNSDPKPTSLQRKFLFESRQYEEKRRKQFVFGLSFGGCLLLLLCVAASIAAFTAVRQTKTANTQTQIALSRQLASNSFSVSRADLDLVMLLSAQSYNFADTREARTSLFNNLLIDPYVEGVMGGYGSLMLLESSDITYILETDPRFGNRGWMPIDENYVTSQYPFITIPPNPNVLWGFYGTPNLSRDGKSVAYSICRAPIQGGTAHCDTTIVVWNVENGLFGTDNNTEEVCRNTASSEIDSYRIDYLGGGKFSFVDMNSRVLGQFISSDIKIATQQYDIASTVWFDLNEDKDMLVVAIAYGRHWSELAIMLWDIETGEEVGMLYHSSGWVGEYIDGLVQFDNGGNKIYICESKLKDFNNTENGDFYIKVDPDYQRDLACKIAGRNLTHLEWNQYVGTNVIYKKTCPEFPEGGYPDWNGR